MKKLLILTSIIFSLTSLSFAETIITGEAKMGFGFTPNDFIWKRANYDLNERNFRLLSGNQLNNKEDTYDPGIYDRLQFAVDGSKESSPLKFHTNISIDPWSFTGKSDKVTVAGTGGDRAEIELLYWSNTGYTVNQNYTTLLNGDGFALPELKLTGNRILPTSFSSSFSNTFNFPEIKINQTFQPMREFWADYKLGDKGSVRLFPLALQDQALSSDDPLKLSNNKTYWEESPWLANWKPGNFNAGANDFTKGQWDDSLAFFTRNSDGVFLTALRGASLTLSPMENSTINATIATPKNLWQEYERIDSVPLSIRGKKFLNDNWYIGTTTASHLGFADNALDSTNFVNSIDTGFSPIDNIKIDAQVSVSRGHNDMTDFRYDSRKRGQAYYVSLLHTNIEDANTIKSDFFELKPINDRANYSKDKIYYALMTDGFESSLANYRETRDDSFWARHLHFRQPQDAFFGGGSASISYNDIRPFGFGDGIDYGRYVVGWRNEASFGGGVLKETTDFRNVHAASTHKYIETELRSEWDHKTTEKLSTKLLFIHTDLPQTKGGVDPFIFDSDTGAFLLNSAIPDAKNPSLTTGSLGAKYALLETVDIHGIWEYTNDITAGSDNFPRGLYNSSSFGTFSENGVTFRKVLPFLYSQGNFDLPPYEYFNIFRTGLDFHPNSKFNIYLDYTRNSNNFAGQIDGNVNHVGLEVSYIPTKKIGFFTKYTWSRFNDINRLLSNSVVAFESHHNIFAEVRYNFTDNENLVLEYGVGPSRTLNTASFDPFGDAILTPDTQQIFRLWFQKKF